MHVTFAPKNFNVSHFTSNQNHFTQITPVHYTSYHFTYLHSNLTWIPSLVTTKDASNPAGNWFWRLLTAGAQGPGSLPTKIHVGICSTQSGTSRGFFTEYRVIHPSPVNHFITVPNSLIDYAGNEPWTYLRGFPPFFFFFFFLFFFFFFFFFFNPCGFWPAQLSLSILSRKVFTECRCQRHIKPPTWRTSD